MAQSVTLIEGDGIGPEIIRAARRVVDATGVKIQWEMCEAGAKVFKKGLEDIKGDGNEINLFFITIFGSTDFFISTGQQY